MMRRLYRWVSPCLPFLLFFLFNTIMLAPEVYFKRTTSTFFPSSRLDPDPILGVLKIIFVRENGDFFRMIAEVGIWFCLLAWLSRRKQVSHYVKAICFALLLIILLVEWYFQISYKLYGEAPNILNDLVLIQEVLPLFLRELGLFNGFIWVALALGFLVFLTLLYRLVTWSIRELARFSERILMINLSFIVLTLFFLQIGISYVFRSEDHPNWKTLRWVTPRLIQSLHHQDTLNLEEKANYFDLKKDQDLVNKPNIYLLFLESYGSVIQLLEEEGPLYIDLMDSLENELKSDGWNIASDYSIPPVIGGRSWLSFTSAMTGVDVRNHIYFNEFLTNHYDFPHLVRFLKHHDYYTYRMKTMSNQKQSTQLSYALADRFYAFDQWIKFDDIPYQGFRYDKLGGVPDQYALHYFADSILDPTRQPFFFFSINMSSHAPWQPAPPLVTEWQSLDERTEMPENYTRKLSQDESMLYYRSVAYVLKVMVRFILEEVDDDALVILIGDHQPPGMTFLCEGIINEYAVPMHIITKNKAQAELLYQAEFVPGFKLDLRKEIKRFHQDIYELIIQLLQDI